MLAAAGADGICRTPQAPSVHNSLDEPKIQGTAERNVSPALSAGGAAQMGQSSRIRKQKVRASFWKMTENTFYCC